MDAVETSSRYAYGRMRVYASHLFYLCPLNSDFYAWDIVDNDTMVQSPKTDLIVGRTHSYTADHCYGPETDNRLVFDHSVKELVQAAMGGYHTSVLAYGQT
jgi:hypothetical protein